jgi:hypothetical protein
MTSAFCQRVHEAVLKTQNYDKGFDQFVRKVDAKEEMSATVSVSSGCHGDHEWAVYCIQGSRRCLLLDTAYGLTGDEVLWTALSAGAAFQPRKALRRHKPGQLFYPSEASHILEKYWHDLSCLDQHPDFASEAPYCQQHVTKFSKALAAMKKNMSFIPRPVAEAKQSDFEIG